MATKQVVVGNGTTVCTHAAGQLAFAGNVTWGSTEIVYTRGGALWIVPAQGGAPSPEWVGLVPGGGVYFPEVENPNNSGKI